MALPLLAYKAMQNRPKMTINNKVTTVVLAAGLGLGIFFGVRGLVRRLKRNLREGQALNEGNPATYATQLKMAFENDSAFGWGTDEEAVFQVLEQVPSASLMRKVQRAYRDLYNRHLAADLKNELTTKEYTIALKIINTKT